jgi:hypothetical protein
MGAVDNTMGVKHIQLNLKKDETQRTPNDDAFT